MSPVGHWSQTIKCVRHWPSWLTWWTHFRKQLPKCDFSVQMWPISDCFHDNLSSTNMFFVQLFFWFWFLKSHTDTFWYFTVWTAFHPTFKSLKCDRHHKSPRKETGLDKIMMLRMLQAWQTTAMKPVSGKKAKSSYYHLVIALFIHAWVW